MNKEDHTRDNQKIKKWKKNRRKERGEKKRKMKGPCTSTLHKVLFQLKTSRAGDRGQEQAFEEAEFN